MTAAPSLASLSVDGTWSEGQVRRYSLVVPKEAVRVEGYLPLTAYSREARAVFYALPEVASLPLPALRHLAGVAEMRIRLGLPPDPNLWRVSFARHHRVEEPDAVWFTPSGPVAVEYDAGRYTRRLLTEKRRAFALRYAGQVWGAPVSERVETLKSLLGEGVRVIVAPWY